MHTWVYAAFPSPEGTFSSGKQSTKPNETLCHESLLEREIERHRRHTQGAS